MSNVGSEDRNQVCNLLGNRLVVGVDWWVSVERDI